MSTKCWSSSALRRAEAAGAAGDDQCGERGAWGDLHVACGLDVAGGGGPVVRQVLIIVGWR